MKGRDLFGNDDARLPAGFLRPEPAPVALDLIDYAARLAALASGRALSQERAEIIAPERDIDSAGSLFGGGAE